MFSILPNHMIPYRPEIDGLRALAVVPVILFHAGFEIFSGGFVGVDVFFVISGYLITSIILAQKAAGTFSLLNFYERRARRILPSLFLVMAVCMPFAWLLLWPDDMKEFAKSLVAVSLFVSNIFFYVKSDYFDTDAELKPLLHTWSLAVEEQYYVLFPLFLMVMWRYARRWTVTALTLIAVSSFAFAQLTVYNNQAAAFFLLPTRGWEIATGALVAFYHAKYPLFQPRKILQEIGSLIGLLLILYSVLAYSEVTPFPSVYTLVPIFGSALIILLVTSSTLVGRLLSTKVFVGIGLISYSAYLWHQPLFAFSRHRSFTEPKPTLYFALIFACFLLAYLTWRYVENPIRQKQKISRRVVFISSGLATLFFIAVGLAVNFQHGFKNRFTIPESLNSQFKAHDLPRDCEKSGKADETTPPVCFLGSQSAAATSFALYGDSHSSALNPVFNEIGLKKGIKYVHLGLGGCPPLLGVDVSAGNFGPGVCKSLAQRQFDYVRQNGIKTVVLVARWSLYTQGGYSENMRGYFLFSDENKAIPSLQSSRKSFENGFLQTIQAYSSIGTKVIVLFQIPQQYLRPSQVFYKLYDQNLQGTDSALEGVRELSVRVKDHFELQAYYRAYLRKLAVQGLIQLVDPDPYFCSGAVCSMGTANDSFYLDDDHVNSIGAMKLLHAFEFMK